MPACRGEEAVAAVQLKVPLGMMDRHGLVAGGPTPTPVAQKGARFARSGTFNTILRSVLGILSKRH